ncbi:MAG TPA: tRNA (guanosine(37)-N1)-methyltransferase TrmD [Myxococcaceae bacterium]
MWQAEILTLFPAMVTGYLEASILGKARARGLVRVEPRDIREHAEGKHRVTDDAPYGGGAGMVMKPEPVVAAIEAARLVLPGARVLLTSPRGDRFSQEMARTLAAGPTDLILVAGRYEGVDERVCPHVDAEVSLGDFVLTGGELAALCIVDAVARLLPGVLGNADSSGSESFEGGLLEYPHYTRPADFRGATVPEVLQGGDHARIARWRRWHQLQLTRARRPDLLEAAELSDEDRRLLALEEKDL